MSEILVWVLFFIFYLIFQVLGKKKRPKPQSLPPESSDSEDTPSRPATLEDALREIQEALRQPREQPEELPAPATEPARRLPAPARKLPERTTSSDFRNLEAPPREWGALHTRRKEAPRPVDVRPSSPKPAAAPLIGEPRKAASSSPTTPAGQLRAEITADFRDPRRLQKAWLLKEVFDDPAYKRLIKPRP